MKGNYRPWAESDNEKLEKLVLQNKSIEDMQKELDRSKISIVNQMHRLKTSMVNTEVNNIIAADTPKARRLSVEKEAITFMDMRKGVNDYDDVWNSVLGFQGMLEEHTIEQTEAHLSIKTDKWIGVAFMGDLHIGNIACDYSTMLAHRDMIKGTPNLYIAFNGDYCDNYLPSSPGAGMFEALVPPAMQQNLAKQYIESISSQVLAMVAGCHDIWGMKASDWDLTQYLAKHGNSVYLGNGGTLWLTIGKQVYKIMMRHKYRYNSADNPTSTVKKMFEKMGGFDVGVVSHHHTACLEEGIKEGLDGPLKRLFLRAGTYKIHDRFGRQLGLSEGTISVPVVLFNPDTRDIRGFQDLGEGIDYLAYLNSKRKKKITKAKAVKPKAKKTVKRKKK